MLRQPWCQTADSFSQRLPGEQHLQRLGEAGLPAAVAADDQGQPRTGREAQRRGLADAAEAADRERPQERGGRPRRGRARQIGGRPLPGLTAELGRQALLAVQRGQQHIGRLLRQRRFGYPLEHDVQQHVIHVVPFITDRALCQDPAE